MAGVVSYNELKLRMNSGPGTAYRVLASVDGAEASGTLELPFNEWQLENFVLRAGRSRGRRGDSSSALGDAKQFGGKLFEAVFSGQIRDLYRDALTRAEGTGRGLRVTLCLSGAPDLMYVPWEYLYDAPNFLAASAFTPVVRYLDLPRGSRALRVEPPINILAMVSSPAELETLDVSRERENLEEALAELRRQGAVSLHWLERPTLTALLSALESGEFHVLHYIGHGRYDSGSERGVLVLEDDTGRSRDVDGDELGQILQDHRSLRLVSGAQRLRGGEDRS
jgi:CHAT domain